MAFVLGDRPIRLLTVDDVLGMLDAGLLEDAQGLELLHGVLAEKSVKGNAQGALKRSLSTWPHVHRDPTPDGYATITTHGPAGTLTPLAVGVEPLDLSTLFSGLR
jgi:hypothetical protein